MKNIKLLIIIIISTFNCSSLFAQKVDSTDAEKARILALALAAQVDSTGAESAYSVFFYENELQNKLNQYKKFTTTPIYKKHDNYKSYVQSMRKSIAISYAENNDLQHFENWVKKIDKGGYVHKNAVEEGFLALVKTQKPALMQKKIKTYLDDLMKNRSWDKPSLSLYQGLLNIYVHTLSRTEEFTLLPYLSVLYEKYGSFPLDASIAVIVKDMDYSKLLTYLYAKNLAAVNKEDEMLDILNQGIEMDLFKLEQILAKVQDFKNIPQFTDKLKNRLNDGEQQFKANVLRLFEKQTLDGEPLELLSHPVKYIILDFWGSWCIPCRGTHPKMRELYAEYKSKGLEIVSISKEISEDLAGAKVSWERAVKMDHMTWPQLLNNEDQEQFDAVKTFSIGMFPTKILLDGKTFKCLGVFKNTDGSDDLHEKIKDLLN